MRRSPEVACWLWLGRWNNNAANSRPCPAPLSSRVLRSCMMPSAHTRHIDPAIDDALRMMTG